MLIKNLKDCDILFLTETQVQASDDTTNIFFHFFFYLVRCPTSYERAQNTRLHR